MEKYTLASFWKQFPDENACLEFIKNARWPNGITCARCERVTNHFRIAGRKVYSCEFCAAHISPTAHTIFHKSSTPLRFWFHAIFSMALTRTGVSAKQLEREIGVTYKTALRMLDQIHKLMTQGDISLFGEVEVDETYVGGKHRKKRGRGAEGKTIVFGMLERGGRVVVKVVPNVSARTLLPMIQEHVLPGTTVYTDELGSYNRLSRLGYPHQSVRHRAKQYVDGNAHINGLEGLWGNIKRSIDGIHHAVSPEYLQAYLDSYVFRFNHRFDDTPMFLQLLAKAAPAVPVRRGG